MSTTVELLERFKLHLAVRSDHAAGRMLGVKPQTISNWRTRGSQAEPKLIEMMCRKLGEDSAPWLLRAQAEQAHDPANGLVWKRLATRLGVSLTALAVMLETGADILSSLGSLSGTIWSASSALALPFGKALVLLSSGAW